MKLNTRDVLQRAILVMEQNVSDADPLSADQMALRAAYLDFETRTKTLLRCSQAWTESIETEAAVTIFVEESSLMLTVFCLLSIIGGTHLESMVNGLLCEDDFPPLTEAACRLRKSQLGFEVV
jgi:hypothetical protein